MPITYYPEELEASWITDRGEAMSTRAEEVDPQDFAFYDWVFAAYGPDDHIRLLQATRALRIRT